VKHGKYGDDSDPPIPCRVARYDPGSIDDPAFCLAIDGIVGVIATALADGRKLLLAGNGGSAADAQQSPERCCAGSIKRSKTRWPIGAGKPDLALAV
jgi:hypothetical protein